MVGWVVTATMRYFLLTHSPTAIRPSNFEICGTYELSEGTLNYLRTKEGADFKNATLDLRPDGSYHALQMPFCHSVDSPYALCPPEVGRWHYQWVGEGWGVAIQTRGSDYQREMTLYEAAPPYRMVRYGRDYPIKYEFTRAKAPISLRLHGACMRLAYAFCWWCEA